MEEFSRIQRLPPYVFAVVGDLKMKLRRQNIDIVDFSMGNPDIPTPGHVVDKLVEAAQKPVNHRYSLSKGIPNLRKAVCDRYARLYGVELDPEREAIVTMGSKEGLAHLSLAMLEPGDVVLAPDPTYPIHKYAPIIAGADVRSVPIGPGRDFFRGSDRRHPPGLAQAQAAFPLLSAQSHHRGDGPGFLPQGGGLRQGERPLGRP